ncbi:MULTISPECIES: sulfatase-like hydrolase/transferase [unclassified Psychrobacter]|uniref:sulfatase-like hydrolase/transferase n=1 Tax=unclassified Psychrobacter TaxID=196806 RepID=UPI003FD58C34
MSESIWSKEYKLPLPPIKSSKIIRAILLILLPNLIFLVISAITGTSRPLLNIDYVLPVVLILLNHRFFQWLGFISLAIMTIPDIAMFVIQLFPFMDLEGVIYLSPFILEGPIRYIIFILAAFIYTLSFPFLIKFFVKPIDNLHALIAGGGVLLLTYLISMSDIEYSTGSKLTFGSENNYIAASQIELYLELQDSVFFKEAGVMTSFSPSKFERVVSKLDVPLNDKILLIIVESLGAASNPDLQKEILKPLYQQQHLFDYYNSGFFEAPSFTVGAEIKELCAKDMKGFGLRLVPDSRFPLCLPKILAEQGYQTTALHGASGKLYDRFSWYKKAGFENVILSENIIEAERCSAFNGVCDDEVFPIIKHYFEADRSAFFYWMTLTSHAPYAKKDIYSKRLDCKYYYIEDNEVCRNMTLQAQFFEGLAKLNTLPEMKGVEVILVGDHVPPLIDGAIKIKEYEHLSVTWLHYKIK